MEDKVLVNVRHIINQEKENKKIFHKVKKSKLEKVSFLTKTKKIIQV